MLPMNEIFDINKLDLSTRGEASFYTKWEAKINGFIDGNIDIAEIRQLNKIAETVVKKQHDRITAASLLWRMKNDNIKGIK